MSSPRVRIAARLASRRLLGCGHSRNGATCSRCLADAILPLLAEAFDEGYTHCADTQCANCYSCGAALEFARNPYQGEGA